MKNFFNNVLKLTKDFAFYAGLTLVACLFGNGHFSILTALLVWFCAQGFQNIARKFNKSHCTADDE